MMLNNKINKACLFRKKKIDCAAAIAFSLVGRMYECWKEIKEARGWAKMLRF